MFVSPIIDRELRLALRKHKAVKSRFYAAVAGAGVVGFFLLISLLGGMSSWGSELHTILFYLGLYMAVAVPVTISVGLFSEERHNQTMELLYLAGVRPGELFGGKLVGGVLVASCNILALSPFLAVPFLSGGISLDLFLATVACFPVLLLFVISVGVLASVLCRDDGSALIGAAVIGSGMSLAMPIPYFMGKLLAGAPPFSAHWLILSPAYAPYLVAHHFDGHKPGIFWAACVVTLGWTVLFLGLATLLLKWNWRRELARTGNAGWRAKWELWLYGSEAKRWHLRIRLLEINPFQWLVEQDRKPLAAAWAIIGGVSLIWILGWWIWPRDWPSTMNFYATAMLLLMGMELMIAYTAARRIGMDRRDGVLELLLTTPLMPEEIVDGQLAALKELFRPVRAAVFGLCVLMMLGGLLTRTWNGPALISYGLIWCLLLSWCARSLRRSTPMAMWIAINTGRPAVAIFRRQRGWWWIWMFYNMRNVSKAFGGSAVRFPSGSNEELVIVCIGSFFALCIAAAVQISPNNMRDKLIAEMRSIAREPVPDPHDPRLKKWNVNERLPRHTYDEMAERVRIYPQRVADAERERREITGTRL